MNITEHFTLEELTFSQVALRKGYNNQPTAWAIANLTRLCTTLLEPARTLAAVPLHVDSGFRSLQVNAAVGGVSSSAHTQGRAADLVPIGATVEQVFEELRTDPALPYDQIIIECGAWIHLAIAAEGVPARRQALIASGRPGSWTYHPAGASG